MKNIEPINSPSGETRFKIEEEGFNLVLPPEKFQTMHLYNSQGEEEYMLDHDELLHTKYTFDGRSMRMLLSDYSWSMAN